MLKRSSIKYSQISLLRTYDWLAILSIHGNMGTHNKYTSSHNYSRAAEALEALSSEHVRTKIYSVINEYSTIDDIDHLLNLKTKHNAGAVKFFTPRSPGIGSTQYDEEVVNYIKAFLDPGLGLQKTSSRTELITANNTITVTD